LTIEEVLRKRINKEKLKEVILDKLKNGAKKALEGIVKLLKGIVKLLPTILGYFAILSPFLIAIAGAIAWYNNTPEKRLEKAKKVTEEAKTAAEEAKAAYDDLKSTIEDF
jgi:hypothetical protein